MSRMMVEMREAEAAEAERAAYERLHPTTRAGKARLERERIERLLLKAKARERAELQEKQAQQQEQHAQWQRETKLHSRKVGKELKRYSAEEQRKRKQRIRQIAQRERSEHWHRTEGARPGTADHSLFVGGSKSVAELRQRSHDKLGEVRAACCCPAAVRSCSSCCSCCSCY